MLPNEKRPILNPAPQASGTELRALRLALGWSPVYLAEQFGVAEATVWRWDSGKRSTPATVLSWLRQRLKLHRAHPAPQIWADPSPD